MLDPSSSAPPEVSQPYMDRGTYIHAIDCEVVLGMTAVVSDDVLAELPGPMRIAGPDRYATAAAILRHARSLGLDFDALVLATGENFPDGLTAGALAGALDGVVVLVRGLVRTEPSAALEVAASQRADLGRVVPMGGEAVMSEGYAGALR